MACSYFLDWNFIHPLLSLLHSRSSHSVSELLVRRQPRLPGGQGRATAQLRSDWTVYWFPDSTSPAEHHPPDNHPLLQWPLREQAGVQTELSRWDGECFLFIFLGGGQCVCVCVCVWCWLVTIKATGPAVTPRALPVQRRPLKERWRKRLVFYSSRWVVREALDGCSNDSKKVCFKRSD